MDSNHRRRKPADLQSAPFGHSGICPYSLSVSIMPVSIQSRCLSETGAKLGIISFSPNFSPFFFSKTYFFLISSMRHPIK